MHAARSNIAATSRCFRMVTQFRFKHTTSCWIQNANVKTQSPTKRTFFFNYSSMDFRLFCKFSRQPWRRKCMTFTICGFSLDVCHQYCKTHWKLEAVNLAAYFVSFQSFKGKINIYFNRRQRLSHLLEDFMQFKNVWMRSKSSQGLNFSKFVDMFNTAHEKSPAEICNAVHDEFNVHKTQ